MDIIKYIPKGKSNAIRREVLPIITGLSDRVAREQIEKARRDQVILNLQDGRGYFQPVDEVSDVLHQYQMNQKRARSILAQQRAIKKYLKEHGVEIHHGKKKND